jgi:hypothetical protein
VAEASFTTDAASYVSAVDDLLTRLRMLQSRYGPLPSILATMADYTEDDGEAIHLLENAYFVAEQREDTRNMTYIASSIAQRYVEDLSDLVKGRVWTNLLRQCLVHFPEATELDVLAELEARLGCI